jgi:hypothetical protein
MDVNANKEKREYEVEDLLEMLGGDKYYSMDNIMFVYHSLRGEEEEASYYEKELDRERKSLQRKLEKMYKLNPANQVNNNKKIYNNGNYQLLTVEEGNSSCCEFEESKDSMYDLSTVVKSER